MQSSLYLNKKSKGKIATEPHSRLWTIALSTGKYFLASRGNPFQLVKESTTNDQLPLSAFGLFCFLYFFFRDSTNLATWARLVYLYHLWRDGKKNLVTGTQHFKPLFQKKKRTKKQNKMKQKNRKISIKSKLHARHRKCFVSFKGVAFPGFCFDDE